MTGAAFARIQRFMHEASGIAVEDDKRYFVEDRLQSVMESAKLGSLDDLARALETHKRSDLARTVVETLTINETSFFRDRALFAALTGRILPQLLAANEATHRLRIWCAGCSTGQEPYSLAMLLDEQLRHLPGWHVEILATDLSSKVIEQARSGLYSHFEVQRGLPVALLLRYFSKSGTAWQINGDLRARIEFKVANLLTASPGGMPFDIIFCRNVLFYFDAATKRQVLGHLVDALAPDGILAMGGAERLGALCPALRADAAPFVFVRSAAGRSERQDTPSFQFA